MAPNIKDVEHEIASQQEIHEKISTPSASHSHLQIVWRNVLPFIYLHVGAAIGLYYMVAIAKWQTPLYALVLAGFGDFVGITAGAHRLWAHKTYKGRVPLRIFAMVMNCLAVQNDIYEWARDHRVHHKFSETHADPHNAKRGFFFSHMGWLLVRKHPDVTKFGGKVDMSDIGSDPVIQFQRKYYIPLVALTNLIFSMVIPHYVLGEQLFATFYVCGLFRFCFSLHATWLVNSVAHLWGTRPYDKNIGPCENTLVVVFSNGEGWHNYHHAFPYDYRSNEFGMKLNLTTMWIDIMAWLGLAYDRRTVPLDIVKQKIIRTGDGSSYQFEEVKDF